VGGFCVSELAGRQIIHLEKRGRHLLPGSPGKHVQPVRNTLVALRQVWVFWLALPIFAGILAVFRLYKYLA
jgi:hypothetical protein